MSAPASVSTSSMQNTQQLQHQLPVLTGQSLPNKSRLNSSEAESGLWNMFKDSLSSNGGDGFSGIDEMVDDADPNYLMKKIEIPSVMPSIGLPSHLKNIKSDGLDSLNQDTHCIVAGNPSSRKPSNNDDEDKFCGGEGNSYVGVPTVDNCGPSLNNFASESMTILEQRFDRTVPIQEENSSTLQESNDYSRSSRGCNSCNSDDDVPAFLTCNKCGMVFTDSNEAHEHENDCTITDNDGSYSMQEGRVFNDKGTLLKHIVAHYLQVGKAVNKDDKFFFHPLYPDEVNVRGERNVNHLSVVGKCSGGDKNLPANDLDGEMGGDENSDTNCHEEHIDRKESEEEATEMMLVEHLCSTDVDPGTGLPTQKLTVLCGDSGEVDGCCGCIRYTLCRYHTFS